MSRTCVYKRFFKNSYHVSKNFLTFFFKLTFERFMTSMAEKSLIQLVHGLHRMELQATKSIVINRTVESRILWAHSTQQSAICLA